MKDRFGSFKFAFNGLCSLFKNEHNSRIHLLATVISIALGVIFKINFIEWSLLIIVIGIVFLSELLNSSLESLADFIEPEWNKQIGKAKDYASAAVFISAVVSIIVGGIIFVPKILDLF